MGGFAGSFIGKLQYCYAYGTLESTSAGQAYIGGLTGGSFPNQSATEVSYCYANVELNVTSTATGSIGINTNFCVGGLVGRSEGPRIESSYAAGNVTVTKINSNDLNIFGGGLIGALGSTSGGNYARTSISNCYAAGNVTVTGPVSGTSSGTSTGVFAGGLCGSMACASDYGIYNSFASGMVLATNTATTTPGLCYAGGIVGRQYHTTSYGGLGGDVINNACLGGPVGARGSGTIAANRIAGLLSSNGTKSNRALAAIYVGTNTDPAGNIAYSTAGDGSVEGVHGLALTRDEFCNQYTWSTLLDFDSLKWIIDSSIYSRGYPLIRREDGAALGGQ
jgi:hypothetical protein